MSEEKDNYQAGREAGNKAQDVLGAVADGIGSGFSWVTGKIGEGASWAWNSSGGQAVRGFGRGMVDGTSFGDGLDKAEEVSDTIKK